MFKSVTLRNNSISQRKKIMFNKDVMCWLKIWLNSQLKFITYINKKLTKIKTAEIYIKCLNDTYKLAFRLIKQIQIKAILSLVFYKAELQQKRQKNHKYKV